MPNNSLLNPRHWLMKTEPDVFSIDDLEKNKTSLWEGVRNYQARNFMLNDMQIGDKILFYHSNAKPSGIAGLANVSKTALPDPTQFDKNSEYFDPKATEEKPIWFCTEIKFIAKFNNFITLNDLKKDKHLTKMLVVKKGSRLSIQPVLQTEFDYICHLAHDKKTDKKPK